MRNTGFANGHKPVTPPDHDASRETGHCLLN